MNLKNKTVLITGASSGIGKSLAYLLAARGMNVVIIARTLTKLKSIAQEIESKYPVKAYAYAQDLSKTNAAQNLYDQLKGDKIEIDLLINNAGFGKWGAFEDFHLEVYGEMLQLNINSLTELCYLFLDDLRKKPEAGIINVGSTGSFVPVPYSAVYGASKSYVLYFTEALVGELSGSNVKVFCLCPSATDTDFNRVANDGVSNEGVDMKSPDEVAREGIDAFLSSGKHYVLTGRKSMLLMIKVFSRKKIIQMVTKVWRKRLGMSA